MSECNISGIPVTLYERTQTGTDDFNCPIYTETAVTVENVLVAPAGDAGEEMTDVTSLDGSRAVYILGIPKGDTHTWEGNTVEFFGERWRVIGKPTKGIDDMIPLDWNLKVRVESIVTSASQN